MAIRHEDLWRALDTLAAENGMTPSGLARAAGLDATTFNRSKRRTRDGRPRWPSTESVSLALAATGATLESFTALVRGARAIGHPHGLPRRDRDRTLRMTRLERAEAGRLFDGSGLPAGSVWERHEPPALAESGDYALRIETDAHAPVLCRGDLVMVSPDAPIEEGDRILASRGGTLLAARLHRHGPDAMEIEAPGERALVSVTHDEMEWIHRITWIGR